METRLKNKKTKQNYTPLVLGAGIGSMLGSGIIVGLSATITVWQNGIGLTNTQVGILSGALTFAIAFGSLAAGKITKLLGLIRSFNLLNLFYAMGAVICVFANGFEMLLAGLIITGFASGADLPISLTVISHDAPDEKTSASLVSSTQIFWQIGVFMSYICSFVVSNMQGAMGARVVFAILAILAAITFVWRTTSPKFKQFHALGDEYRKNEKDLQQENVSIKNLLFGKDKHKYMGFFLCILIFYICWNLLANTWGQFQTFTLVKANASQSFATGAGIVLNIIGLLTTTLFASLAGSKHRNKAFVIGILIQFAAMVGMSAVGNSLWAIVICIGCYNFGNPMAGEAIYKVWTQESFPSETRASLQGFINGFSRLCCGLFAFITPALVLPETIKTTMIGFAGIVIISALAGFTMIKLQQKYHNKNA
ncbi:MULTISPECIES: MFS transporter [Bacillota]|jgi:inositol transporter-like SP family MFS transporter|uniref:MFS transporter n=2 Tax=Amedibacillus TaxID=2749846 RepID=A0A7G9GK34_9FIRM|nr:MULTISPECIES: MFS transporter [Bacillota]QNM11166.1 MFS transporter [[Eubacterium] hominis]MCH4284783.1 MFS transporter [Amedibacillus hominis]RGB52615.1 MFS transporter [Absiella sp. AM22-9]RGB57088.1 MFS transporter [Absiella sp. AM10-20]RGB68061.1 MFS transporter [Absiella sp. AM09-45]